MFYAGPATALAAVLLYRLISHWAVLPAGGICCLPLRRRHSMVIPQPPTRWVPGRELVHGRAPHGITAAHRTGYLP